MLYSSRLPSEDNSTFILKDIAEDWYRTRLKDCRDPDGLELVRALAVLSMFRPIYRLVGHPLDHGIPGEIRKQFNVPRAFELKYTEIIRGLLQWLIWAHPVDGETDFLLAALEASVAAIPRSELIGLNETYWGKTRTIPQERLVYLDIARWQRDFRSGSWTGQHHARLWKAALWLHEPMPDLPGEYVTLTGCIVCLPVWRHDTRRPISTCSWDLENCPVLWRASTSWLNSAHANFTLPNARSWNNSPSSWRSWMPAGNASWTSNAGAEKCQHPQRIRQTACSQFRE